jgi:hypothetical protein
MSSIETVVPCINKKCIKFSTSISCGCEWYFPIPTGYCGSYSPVGHKRVSYVICRNYVKGEI